LCLKTPGKEVSVRVVSPEGLSANSGKESQKKVCVSGKFPLAAVPGSGRASALAGVGADYAEGPL
jgi:hypothetical protein